jgi:nucleotide-binding universal stress UspA family protein
LASETEREGLEKLWKLDMGIRIAGGTVAGAHLRVGEVVSLAEELGVDLIVVGSRSRDRLRRALMGSVSGSIVRNARCPVLGVRP